jgi:hypothetical protein
LGRTRRKGLREKKADIAREACAKLMTHATVEDDISYPAARAASDADAFLDETEGEASTPQL